MAAGNGCRLCQGIRKRINKLSRIRYIKRRIISPFFSHEMKSITYIVLFLFTLSGLFAQHIVINEVMTKNQTVLFDEDGSTSDWFELYNSGNAAVNLADYSLADRKEGKQRWVFPNYSLGPESYIVVFASGKDRKRIVSGWETVIDKNTIWQYHEGEASISSDWNSSDYNDLNWPSGRSGFGYGDNDDETIINNAVSIYVRNEFEIEDVDDIAAAILHIDFDDGFVAYLNGTEIARFNMGDSGSAVSFNSFATDNHEAQMYNGGSPEVFPIADAYSLLKSGDNILAIEVHNVGSSSSDMSLIPFLTLGYTIPIEDGNGIPDFIELPATKYHTDFSLSAAGETLFLFTPDSTIEDSLVIPELSPDISYGRTMNSDSLLFFLNATPGEPNIYEGFSEKTGQPTVNIESGFYNSPLEIQITASNSDSSVVIYYTIDGSIPSTSSQVYTEPIHLSSTRVLRVVAQSTGALPSNVVSKTYFISQQSELPVISIITDPPNLWDYNEGMYVLGPNAESNNPYFGANFWQDWEKKARIQFFETDKSLAIDMDAGIKIFGGWSRALDMKSLSLFARKKYGEERFEHKIFPELPFDEYASVLLRNSGNDWNITMFRDAFLQVLVEDLNIDGQAYRPAVVYLNGDYWGIHNIREKINENYLAQHYDIDPAKIDILEFYADIVEGSNEDYLDLLDYISSHSLSIQQYYEVVADRIDIDSFIDYQTAQIFFDNTDWPGNNSKFWHPQVEGGKWRWLLYDTDFGFGIWNTNNYTNNTLGFALEANGPEWPNPPWSTFMLRNLIRNSEFKTKFINRFADISNTVFTSPNINSIVDSLVQQIDREMLRHISRWNAFSYSGWKDNINNMKTFGKYRIPALRTHYRTEFGLNGFYNLSVTINNENIGSVRINSIMDSSEEWLGVYFKGVAITLTALPRHGYKFAGWEGDIESTDPAITIAPTSDMNIHAAFIKDEYVSSIVINEINYNSSPEFDTEDWVECFNGSENDYDLSGWYMTDSDTSTAFYIPQQTILKSGDYMVLTRDSAAFDSFINSDCAMFGNFPFGLSNGGDEIKLYDSNHLLIDSVSYSDTDPWPSEADGTGKTLSLVNPDLDNASPENWGVSKRTGTPGFRNDNYITDVAEESLVTEFRLGQNYPNPFNPTTTIEYTIPFGDLSGGLKSLTNRGDFLKVRLVIYDILGREVSALVDEFQYPGSYKVQFHGKQLTSGVYFYTLSYGDKRMSRKMVLLK